MPGGTPSKGVRRSSRIAAKERARESGTLERASLTLAIASLPYKARYTALDIIYLTMTNDPLDEIPIPKPTGGWFSEMFSTTFGSMFPAVEADSASSAVDIDYERIRANYGAVDIDGNKGMLEAYIRSAFCVCLGLPAESTSVDVEDTVLGAMSFSDAQTLARRIEGLSRAFPQCFNQITPDMAAAIQDGQVLKVYEKVRDSLCMTSSSILDAMPYVGWLLWGIFGERLQELSDHTALFDGTRSEEHAPGSQFELPVACCAAIAQAEKDREEYAQRSIERAKTLQDKEGHEARLAFYENVANNYDALVKRENEIIREQAAIEEDERIAKGISAQQRAKEEAVLDQIERENEDRLRPYRNDSETAQREEENAQRISDQAKNAYDDARARHTSLKNRIKDEKEEIEELKRTIDRDGIRIGKELSELSSQLRNLQLEKDRLEKDYALAADKAQNIEREYLKQEEAERRAIDAVRDYENDSSKSTDSPEYTRLRQEAEYEKSRMREWTDSYKEAERKRDEIKGQLEQVNSNEKSKSQAKDELERAQTEHERNKERLDALSIGIRRTESDLENVANERDRYERDYRNAQSDHERRSEEARKRRSALQTVEGECNKRRREQASIVSDIRSEENEHRSRADKACDMRIKHIHYLDDIHYAFQNQGTLIPEMRSVISNEHDRILGLENRMKALSGDATAQKRAFDAGFAAYASAYCERALNFRDTVLNEHFGESLLGGRMEFLEPNDAVRLFNAPLSAFNNLEKDLFRKVQADERDTYDSELVLPVYELSAGEIIKGFDQGDHALLFEVDGSRSSLSQVAVWMREAALSASHALPYVNAGKQRRLPVRLSMNEQTGLPPMLAMIST